MASQSNPPESKHGSAAGGGMQIISFANQKGGVGKTTSAINCAAGLGMRRQKTLLVDMDPQGNATGGVGISKKQVRISIYDVLIGRYEAAEAVMPTSYENLSILPSNINLAGCELELVDTSDRAHRLKNALDTLRGFDYIIIDCPPSLGLLTINALAASTGLIVPMQCEYFAMEGLSQLVMTMRKVKNQYNPALMMLGVLVTVYDGRLTLSLQVMDELKKFFPNRIFKSVIPRNVRISEAQSYGQPVIQFDRACKGAEKYLAFVDELLAMRGAAPAGGMFN